MNNHPNRWRTLQQEETKGGQLDCWWVDCWPHQPRSCGGQVHPGAIPAAARHPAAEDVRAAAEAADSARADGGQGGWPAPAAARGPADLHAAAAVQAGAEHGGQEDPGDGAATDRLPPGLPAHQPQGSLLHAIPRPWLSQCPGNQCLGQHRPEGLGKLK